MNKNNSYFQFVKKALTICALMLISLSTYAQVTGIVYSDSGSPLIGVNVSDENSQSGTITDIDGRFSLSVDLPTKLRFSYVGYGDEVVAVNSNKELSITLKEGFALEDVVVTARRRVEGIQDTPISITAIQGQVLEQMGVDDLTGIGDMAPNLTFSTTGTVSGSSSAAVAYIRGVGQADYVPVTDPGVGIYVDDVYLGRTIGAVMDLVDLKSVEVIRGPQGTLFGRNTIGGAIVLNSNEPTDKTTGRVSVTGGSYLRNDVILNLSTPLADGVGLSINALRKNRDGYVERVNVPDSRNLGDENVHGGKVMLNIAKKESPFKLKLIADYVREREESAAEQNLYFHHDRAIPQAWNKGVGISTASGYDENDPLSGTNTYNESLNLGPFKTGETSLSQNDIDAYGFSANAGYDFGNGYSTKLILAYRELKAKFSRQVDGSALDIFENRDLYNQDQFSADFRINKSTDKLDLVTGLFYFQEDVYNELAFSGVYEGIVWPALIGGKVDNSNYAAYGEATYKLTDKLSATAGLRYTNETKRAEPDAFRGGQFNIDAPKPTDVPKERSEENGARLIDQIWQENSFSKVTWRANLAYKANDHFQTYASVSTGFKSGGFEWRVTNPSFYNDPSNDYDGDGDGDLPQFKPETVVSYELGAKWDAPTTDLRVNGAVFYSDYTDMQIAANPPGSIATFQTNAGDSRIYGLELETIYVPTSSLMINAGYGYTNAKYTDLIDGVTVTTDDNFVLTPKHMLTFGASYIVKSDFGKFTPRIDGHYKSRVDFEAQNSDYVYDDGHTALNASIKYEHPSKVSLTAGVENLTNALYIIGGDANTAIGYENGIYARPRNYYLTLDYRF